jgi:hypothetical protein
MPWVTFTEDHVRSACAAREMETYEDTATAESEGVTGASTPRLPGIVEIVVARIRGAIRGNPKVETMGEAGTIPDFAVYHAAVLARTALLGLNPVAEGMTDPRRDEHKAAEKFVESLMTMSPAAFGDDPVASTCENYGSATYLDF